LTLLTFLTVLFAAVLHATWNALVKSNGDKVVSMTAITLGRAPLALLAIPFVPFPDRESWLLLGLSVIVHVFYQLSLMRAYRLGDFTQVYPIARGSAPALVTLISLFGLGVVLTLNQITAICLILAGIFCLSLLKQTDGLHNPKAVMAALLTGCCIACYSLLDGFGARAAGTAVGYIAWMSSLSALVFSTIIGFYRPDALKAAIAKDQIKTWFGGAASITAYVLVVWAMTEAPIAVVTALRETSTVFALFIGVLFLKERLTAGKVVATLLTLSGVLLLRFGA